MGRPSKYTDAVGLKIVEQIRKGMPVKFAAALAGVGEQTLRDWLAKGEAESPPDADEPLVSFALLYREAEAEHAGEMLAKIDGDAKGWQRHAWALERRFPREFAQRKLLEHTGADGGPIETSAAAVVVLPALDEPPAANALAPEPGPADPVSRKPGV